MVNWLPEVDPERRADLPGALVEKQGVPRYANASNDHDTDWRLPFGKDEKMSQWSSVDEVLDFAIEREGEAEEFYTALASRFDLPAMRAVFEEFAREEAGHKAKLQGVKGGGCLAPSQGKILDLQIGDYLVDVEPGAGLNYQEALILAMKREKASFRLYTDLAAATDAPAARDLLLALAQEEAKHKLRFEIEYDDQVLSEN